MIAGTIVVFGDGGPAAGLWHKRGSIVALGAVAIPSTYRVRLHVSARRISG